MDLFEKLGYVKGLVKGLDMDESTKEGKILLAMLELLDEITMSVADLEEANEEMTELIDGLDEDLGALEEDFYDDCDCDDCEDDCEELYEVECPNCHESMYVDEEALEEGGIKCPDCGEEIEFDLDAMEDEDE